MSRKIRFSVMTLAVTALIAASASAAPTRIHHRESSPEVGMMSGAWNWLASWLRAHAPVFPHGITPTGSSNIDPNGGPH